MGTFFVVVAGLVGASIGSFLNVVIWRLPRKENLSHPGSHCPRCNRPIRWFDNLPVVSWLLLRARCRACLAPIAWRYPFVELLTATLFVLAALRFPNPLDATAIALLLAALVAITFIDIDHRIIPDAITKPGMALALILAVVTTLHPGDWIYGLKPGLNKLLHSGSGILAGIRCGATYVGSVHHCTQWELATSLAICRRGCGSSVLMEMAELSAFSPIPQDHSLNSRCKLRCRHPRCRFRPQRTPRHTRRNWRCPTGC